MAVFAFPAASFTVEGSPEAIRESGRSYARFATVAGEAADGIGSLDSGSWVGSEGDTYRAKVAELTPPLRVAHGAFGEVAAALDGFAVAVESAQRRMAAVRADAESVHSRLASATGARDGLTEPDDAAKEADPQAQGRYDAARSAADARVNGLTEEWSDQLGVATSILSGVREAAGRAAKRVREAARRSPTAGQNWFADHWEKAGHWVDEHAAGLRDWIAEHANVLRTIAGVMRVVGQALVAFAAALAALSAAAGFFSFGIGWLGEIPAGLLFMIGSGLWGAGDALDTVVDWGEGKIDGSGMLWRVGLALGLAAVGGPLIKLGGKALLKLLERTGMDKKIAEFVERLLGRARGGPTPPRVPVTRDNAPGVRPRPGAGPNPVKPPPASYEYDNPGWPRRNDPMPTERRTRGLGRADDYAAGSAEHMAARWRDYQARKGTWTWERWHANYVENMGRKNKGEAFEKAFAETNGLTGADGWVKKRVRTPDGKDRDYDLVNESQGVAYELKSGVDTKPGQLAKDVQMIRAHDWKIVYVFGSDVPASTVKKLEDLGITVQLWKTDGVPVG